MGRPPRDFAERFWEKVNKQSDNDCWIWNSAKVRSGYGAYRLHNQNLIAHRVAYELTYGKIENGLCVCHRCDNRACVNPNHLFLGTHQDNTLDAWSKGRAASDNLHTKKLSSADIIKIRQENINGISQSELARRFNVTHGTIGYIVRRVTWKQVK